MPILAFNSTYMLFIQNKNIIKWIIVAVVTVNLFIILMIVSANNLIKII